MSLTSHLDELRKKHQSLSDAVDAAQKQPFFDELKVAQMKKQKLHLKQEITRLSDTLH